MKRSSAAIVLLIQLLFSTGAVPANDFAVEIGKFSLKLYKEVAKESSGNVVLSPFSVQTALALVYHGAGSDTEREFSTILHLNKDKTVVSDYYKTILEHHLKSEAVKIANKIYLNEGFSVKPEFAQLATEQFFSGAEVIDTRNGVEAAEKINSWVGEKTDQKIKNLVEPNDVKDAATLIVNALHFKANWAREFRPTSTRPRDFWISERESKKVDMMKQTKYFSYGEFDAFKAVKLDYKNTDIGMLFLLPNDRSGLSALESRVDELNLCELQRSLENREVDLSIPKFKVEFDIKLKDVLVQMGLGTAFSDNADFSNLSEKKLKIGDVIHKAVIEVDEKGTEAAAATAIRLTVGSSPELPKQFIADHPFLYALVDQYGHVFFMGRYSG